MENHYIDNEQFVAALTEHRAAHFAAVAAGTEPPQVSRYIAECFMLLAKNLANRYNFNRYTWKDDMCSEAHYVCVKSAHKFDPTYLVNGKPNAFGYFNRLCWQAFTDFIKLEKVEAYVKAKKWYMTPDDAFELQEHDEGEFNPSTEFMPYFDVEEFEKKDAERREKARKKKETKVGLEAILDTDEPTPEEEDRKEIQRELGYSRVGRGNV
jgi:hypothetical protein